QPHDPVPVHGAVLVDVPPGQGELVTGLQTHLTRSRRSMTSVMFSLTTSLLSTLSWSVEILLGQALKKLNRATSLRAASYSTIEPFLRCPARSVATSPVLRMSLNQFHSLSLVESSGATRVSCRSLAWVALPSPLTSCSIPPAPAALDRLTATSMSRPVT